MRSRCCFLSSAIYTDVRARVDRALALQALDARVTKPTAEAAATTSTTINAPAVPPAGASGETVTVPVEAAVKPETASKEETTKAT